MEVARETGYDVGFNNCLTQAVDILNAFGAHLTYGPRIGGQTFKPEFGDYFAFPNWYFKHEFPAATPIYELGGNKPFTSRTLVGPR